VQSLPVRDLIAVVGRCSSSQRSYAYQTEPYY